MYLYCKVSDNSRITQPVKAAGTIASYLLIAEMTAMICSGVIPFSNSIACSSFVTPDSSGAVAEDCLLAKTLRNVLSVLEVSKTCWGKIGGCWGECLILLSDSDSDTEH